MPPPSIFRDYTEYGLINSSKSYWNVPQILLFSEVTGKNDIFEGQISCAHPFGFILTLLPPSLG
jgi:hypothetical protein